MKFSKLAVLGAALALAVPFAKAEPISGSIAVGGSDTWVVNSSGSDVGVTFSNPYTITASDVSGTFSSLFSSNTTLSVDFNSLTFANPTGELFTIPVGLASFTIDSFTVLSDPNSSLTPGFYAIAGTGTFAEDGYDLTGGTFYFSTSQTGKSSFEFSGGAVPEPSSLVLLGSGLVSAAGMMLRKRRTA